MKKYFLKLLWGVCLIVFLLWLWLIASIYHYSKIDDAQAADAILVLGASQWNGRPSPVFQARLDSAYDLYRQNDAPKMILTGGVGEGETISEASAGENYLIASGIAKEIIFKEEKGRTTKESLDQVLPILREQNIKSVILVSDGFHMMRLKKMTKDLGLQAFFHPVDDSPINKGIIFQWKYYCRESVVYLAYLVFGI